MIEVIGGFGSFVTLDLRNAINAICEFESKNDEAVVPLFDPDIKQIAVEYLGETTLERGLTAPHYRSKLTTNGGMMYKVVVTTDDRVLTIYTAEVMELFCYALKNQDLTKREYLSRLLYYIDSGVDGTIQGGIRTSPLAGVVQALCGNQARDIGMEVMENFIPTAHKRKGEDLDILEGMIKISKSDANTVHVEAIHDKSALDFMTELKAQLSLASDDIESFYKEDGSFNVKNFRNNVLTIRSMGKRLSDAIEDAIEADKSIKKIFDLVNADASIFYPERKACYIYSDIRLHLMGIDENMTTNRLVRYIEQEISKINEQVDYFMREYDKSMSFRYSANAITPHDKADDK